VTLIGHQGVVTCARFRPAGQLIATASLDKTIRLWDISGISFLPASFISSPVAFFILFVLSDWLSASDPTVEGFDR
jgi:WD40 repeat protein